MSFRIKVGRNEETLCWTCSKLDYEPIQHIDREGNPILYPFPFCPIRNRFIFKGYSRCKVGSALRDKKFQEALTYAMTLEMPRKEEEEDVDW